MYLPKIPTIAITSLIFNVHAWEYGVYCEEINFLFDFYFNNDVRLRNIYEPYLRDDSNMTNFLILFYEETKEFIASNILRSLDKWYPSRVSSIWGGMVRKLSVCKNNICNYNVDCIAMLLSGTNMQTWTIVMDGKMASIENIEIRFKELKKEVTLKKHSIGFMFSGDYCDNFYLNLEPEIFMRLFPDTPLFQVFGYLALGAKDCKEADNNISDGYRRMLELSLTIVTYD
ncbi:hypothetical protein M0802_015841 [Mischocyttarus mexicanus]|nr:hypothetical protein M0802_015841 [Mischocyttarus mexicanus]